MDAHVQAGSWDGVVRVFDFIESQGRINGLRYTIDIFNVLLKALVRIGAPFAVVADYWRRLETIDLKPDAYTWCLLVQSACDAGRMDVAEDIFKEIDEINEGPETAGHLNAFVLTTIMSGFLRAGSKDRAKEIYDEMLSRGIKPLTATFSKIIRAYATEGSEDGFRLAEDFLAGIEQSHFKEPNWTLPAGAVPSFETIYTPLIDAYGKQLRSGDVERLHNRMMEEGGEATITVLTLLLDAYRRANNLEGVQHIWPQLYDRIMKTTNNEGLLASIRKESVQDQSSHTLREYRGNRLCVALSIYIDALSWAGLHADIATVWKQARDAGFAFDSTNWNHLSCALVRAGEPERAFEVVERVLLPYDDHLRQGKFWKRDRAPQDVFVYNPEEGASDSAFREFSSFPGSNSSERRAEAQKLAERRTRHRDILSLDQDESPPGEAGGGLGFGSDFARPLFVLQQFYPTWDIWRPHLATLAHLSWAVAQLSGGHLLKPFSPSQDDGEEGEEEREGQQKENEENQDAEAEAIGSPENPQDSYEERMQAHSTLDRIHERFPRTIFMMRQWNGTAGSANSIRELAERLGGIRERHWYHNPSVRKSIK